MATLALTPSEPVEAANDEQTPRDFETEARSHGWTDAEAFKGDPERWVDAETFVKRADEVLPLLKKRDEANRRKIADLEKMVKRLIKSEQGAYTSALSDLQARQAEAVELNDAATNSALTKEIVALEKKIEADNPSLVGGEDPAEQFDAFREANPWYDKAALGSASETEIEARLFADRLAQKWAREGKDNELSPSEFFAQVAEATEAKFPLLKTKTLRPKPASAVAAVTPRGVGGKQQTGANLPADARTQAIRFHAQGVYGKKTQAEALDAYAKSYDWTA